MIEQCNDVVIILPENALDRCNNPDDWFEKKFLRIENGVLTETTANIPESDILIGYLQLTEIQ